MGRWLTLARKALRRPPAVVVRYALHELDRQVQRPWAGIRRRLFTTRQLLNATRASSADELWDRAARQPFFVSTARSSAIAALFRQRFPDSVAPLLAQADAVLRHEFDLLGSGPRNLGPRLPWHTDFKSGVTWPLRYCHDLDYNDFSRPSDVKVPWELSRMQHLVRLGQAWWLTGDDRYVREFRDEVIDWCERNPFGSGVNWACTMDVALRAASWVWAFHLFQSSPLLRDGTFRELFLRALFLHGEFIHRNLEYSEVRGNHYLVDGVGLLFCGSLFRGAPAPERWWAEGRRIVLDEMLLQVSPDGVDFEQSVAYHRLVLEAFMTAYELLRIHGERIPDAQWRRLERMCEVVAAVTKPDGRAPLLGDADDGRIQKLGTQELNDYRYLLSTAAVWFEHGWFKSASGHAWEETLWLLGENGLRRFDTVQPKPAPSPSHAFKDGGWYVLRGEGAHVFIDAAEVGLRGRGGHGHNDILSFELFLAGMNVVTDCGAYLYTASREWRNRFRSTAFHNTIEVDGEEVNRFVGPDNLWQLHDDARPFDADFADDGVVVRFSAGHNGYERLTPPVGHRRGIVLDRASQTVVIVDDIGGQGTRRLVWRAHLDPGVRASREHDGFRLIGTSRLWFRAIETPAGAEIALEQGWVSPSYGVKVPTEVLVVRAVTALPARFVTVFGVERPDVDSVRRLISGVRR